MDKNDVLFKVKFATKPSKYFQPVLTNSTVTVSADGIDNFEEITSNNDDNITEFSGIGNIESTIDNNMNMSNNDDSNGIYDSDNIDKQLMDEILKCFSDEEYLNKKDIDLDDSLSLKEKLSCESDKVYDANKDLTTKMDLPLADSRSDNDSFPENRFNDTEFKGFKERLFLHASNAKKPVQICVNKPVFLMGSDYSKMDCVIRNNRYVSRYHAKIYYEADCYFIEDVGSLNGTYINGVKLAEGIKYKLETGDVINLADCKFGVKIK